MKSLAKVLAFIFGAVGVFTLGFVLGTVLLVNKNMDREQQIEDLREALDEAHQEVSKAQFLQGHTRMMLDACTKAFEDRTIEIRYEF